MSEGAAVSLLKRAVELDQKKRYTESLVCYKEGLALFMEVIKAMSDERRKKLYRDKADEYLKRAEKLDTLIEEQKRNGLYHEQFKIEDGAVGYSYDRLMSRFLDEPVTKMTVEDPYIRSHHQIMNFLRLCELAVKKCSSLRQIELLTSEETSAQGHLEQKAKFSELENDLKTRSISLSVTYSDTLHDREIRLSTGWVIKMGRGLDIFKPPKGRTVIGFFDQDLRPCHETTVDIFHKNQMIKN